MTHVKLTKIAQQPDCRVVTQDRQRAFLYNELSFVLKLAARR